MIKFCQVQRLGSVPFKRAWDYQNQLAQQIRAGSRPDVLLLLEHPHTYTLGGQASEENLLWDEHTLTQHGVAVHHVDRGGDITYHGPGQIVGYPLLRLVPIGWQGDRLPQVDFVDYLRRLEAVLIRTLASFDIQAMRIQGKTGVWIKAHSGSEPAKIASIGVKVDSQGITRHGFGLNVNTEMLYWNGIVPCGLKNVVMTSMALCLNQQINLFKVLDVVIEKFGTVFGYQMQYVTSPRLS
jgi:lipoyl(octanoyl) transferase